MIPTALIDNYSFWQSENDDIIGFEDRTENNDYEGDGEEEGTSSTSRLKITLVKDSSKDDSGFCNSGAVRLLLSNDYQ
jgi:hypothetical protein